MRAPRLLVGALLLGLAVTACSSSDHDAVPVVSAAARPLAGWVDGAPAPRPRVAPPGAQTPNIIYVLTDDLTWNLLPYLPHVLAMERDGVTFDNYFVTDSLCCPSRTSIFTGEFPHDTHVYDNTQPEGGFRGYLQHGNPEHSFAPTLQGQGYLTGFFGKFLNLYAPQLPYDGQLPYIAPGWSAWDAAGSSGYNELGYQMAVGHRVSRFGSAPADYLTDVLSDKAASFIDASAAAHRPFMAEISTFATHWPYTPAPRDADSFPGLTAPRGPSYGRAVTGAPLWLSKIPPLTGPTNDNLSRAFQLRVQSAQAVDRMIGRLEAQLRRLGIADNTYLVFNSDNGFHLGEHDLRAGKETAFDTDISVPLVVTGPGITPGSRVDALTQNIDLAPTFDELVGATAPPTVDGRSLVPLLHGDPVRHWRTAVLVEHHGPSTRPSDPDYPVPLSGNPPSYEAMRTVRYLYVEYVDGEREFYDLRTDPDELHNLAPTLTPILRGRLHAELAAMTACHGAADCWRAQSPTVKTGG